MAKNNKLIVETYKKRFAQILEYTMPNSDILGEEGEEMQTPEGGDDISMDDPSMGGENMGGQVDPTMGGDPSAMPPQDSSVGDMGADPNMQQPMDANGGQDMTSGFNPQDGATEDTMMGGTDENMMQDGDEVVDITELTDAQEETQEEIEQFDEKFAKALSAIKSLEDLIKSNDSKIDALETELKKRNPTPIEKMNNRAANSYPFNISPKDYWSEKEKTSNYSTDDDNNGKDQEQYTITVGDISNASDWKSISDSMDDNFLNNQTLEKILKM